MIPETLKNSSVLTFRDTILFDMKNDFQKCFMIIPPKYHVKFSTTPSGSIYWNISSDIREEFMKFSEKLIRKFD